MFEFYLNIGIFEISFHNLILPKINSVNKMYDSILPMFESILLTFDLILQLLEGNLKTIFIKVIKNYKTFLKIIF